MRRLGLPLALAATLLVVACGPGDDDQSGGTSPAGDQTGDTSSAGDITDLTTALLTAEDLPAGAVITQLSDDDMKEGSGDTFPNAEYEPSSCGEKVDPLTRDGVTSAGLTASLDADGFGVAVYSGAEDADLKLMAEYLANCGEVTITDPDAEPPLDITVTTKVVDAPDVDADAVAFDVTNEVGGMAMGSLRNVYVQDDGYGLLLFGRVDSEKFDLNELAVAALEKLRSVRG